MRPAHSGGSGVKASEPWVMVSSIWCQQEALSRWRHLSRLKSLPSCWEDICFPPNCHIALSSAARLSPHRSLGCHPAFTASLLTEGRAHNHEGVRNGHLRLGWGAHLHRTFPNCSAKAELDTFLCAGHGLNDSFLLSMKTVDAAIGQESSFITSFQNRRQHTAWFSHGVSRCSFVEKIRISVGVPFESYSLLPPSRILTLAPPSLAR